ncbi:MAG: GGDEF domain-containing protein [Lentisphaerae bacterium]|nr:GGDEF domain-containing protein [Lentisphaerota bacterium]
MTAWLKTQGLRRRLVLAFLLMYLLPVGFLLYLVVRLMDQGVGDALGALFTRTTIAIGIPASALMAVAALALMNRSVKPIAAATHDAERFLQKVRGATYVLPEGDEAQKLSAYLADMIGEMRHRLDDVDRYASQLREANDKLLELAVNDGLTGLYNRKQADHILEVELERAVKFGLPLCLAMADIDRFKVFNDTFGHVAGDEALKRIAEVLGRSVRRQDVCARFGGEEFLMLLPETTLADAMGIAGRVRSAVEGFEFDAGQNGRSGRLTISVGIAEYVTGERPRDLIARADAALYKAKNAGRNRVSV